MRLPVTWHDVFTPTPLAGNQLAVVRSADELDDATMLAFARETRLSETTYVQTDLAAAARARRRGHDLTVYQGLEMGRPSRIDCAWEEDRPRVSGDVVVVADGHLRLLD